MKTTVFVFHQSLQEESRINAALAKEASLAGFEVRDMYKLYPDFNIDIKKEQGILESCDRIVLQFPIQWYQTPALLKEWFDRVFEHGWAYGSSGKALQGKELILAASFGAGADDYTLNGRFHITAEEVLKPIVTIKYHTGLVFLDTFVITGTLRLDENELVNHAKKYVEFISA